MGSAPRVRPLRVLAGAAVFAVGIAVLVLLGDAVTVLFVAFAGIILGVYFRSLVDLLRRLIPAPRTALLSAVVLAHIALVTLFLAWAVPQTKAEVERLTTQIPDALRDLGRSMRGTWLEGVYHSVPSLDRIIDAIPGARAQILGVFSNTLYGVAAIAIIVFVGLYLAWAPGSYLSGVLILFPVERRGRIASVLEELYHTLARWFAGRSIAAAIIGAGTGIGVWALGVPLPFTIGVLAAVLTYIPNVGPILTLIPAALLALTKGWQTSLAVVVIYLAVQFIESYLLTPFIERWAVRIPPALLIVVQALLGVIVGIIGIALAAPLIAVCMVVLQRLYVEDRLDASARAKLEERRIPRREPSPAQ